MFPKKSSLIFRVDRNESQSPRYRHILRIANVTLYMLALLGVALYLFWRAWQMNSFFVWFYFYLITFGLLVSVLALALIPAKGRVNQNAIMRAIALSDDHTLAPATDEQPVSFADLTTLPAQETLGTLNFLGTSNFNDIFATLSVTTTNAFIPSLRLSSNASWIYLWCILIYLLINSATSGDVLGIQELLSGGPFAFILLFVQLSYIIVIIWLFFFVGRRKRFSITADDIGICWHRRDEVASAYHLDWDAIRAFIFIKTPRPNRPRSTDFTDMYLLIGDEAVFMWGARADSNSRIASNYLAKLVVTRTGLQLRDMSAFAAEIIQVKDDKLYAVLAKHRADVPIADILHVIDTRVPPLQARLGKVAASIAVVLVIVLVSVGIFVNVQQHGYFANLPVSIHERTPAYQNGLITPSDDWPVRAPTTANPHGVRYTNNGYQLYSIVKNQTITVFGKPTFGDAAVEVTAHLNQQTVSDFDAIGIAIGGNGANYLLFSMQIDGFLYVEICANMSTNSDTCRHITTSFLHDNSSLHTNVSAANSLMVVSRNDSYLFYINDILIYAFVDAAHLLPAKHKIGLYTAGETPAVTYNDLKIYPIATPYFWAYA